MKTKNYSYAAISVTVLCIALKTWLDAVRKFTTSAERSDGGAQGGPRGPVTKIAGMSTIHPLWIFNGHATGTDWLEVPTIYKAYFLGLNFRAYPQNIWPYMVLTYLHQLDPGDLPLKYGGFHNCEKNPWIDGLKWKIHLFRWMIWG